MKTIQKMGYTQGQTATDPQQLGGVWVCQNEKILFEHRESYKGNCPSYDDILRACGASEELIDEIRIRDPSGNVHSIKKEGKFEDKGKGSKTANRIRRRSMITVRSKITHVTGNKISPRDRKKCVIQTECKSPDTHQLKPPQTKVRTKSGGGVSSIHDLDNTVASLSLNDLPSVGPEYSPKKPKGMSHAIKTLVGPKRITKKEKEKIHSGNLSSDESEDEGTERNEKKKIKKRKLE